MASAPADAIQRDTVELIPPQLDAGAKTRLRVVLTGALAERFAGQTLDIVDETGAVRDRLNLVGTAEGAAQGTCTPHAPDEPGRYTWAARRPSGAPDGGDAAHAGFDLPIEVRAHALSLTVWDVPTAVGRGETFSVRVGIRCSAGCNLSRQRVEIRRGNGHPHVGETGERPLDGTDALYWTEIELQAPAEDGQARWKIAASMDGISQPHSPARGQFAVNVVPPPRHRLAVSVADAATSEPIAGAKVVAHPFRTTTDAQGHAELRLPSGPTRLFVTGPDHIPYQIEGNVTGDMTINAVLDRDVPMSDAEVWT